MKRVVMLSLVVAASSLGALAGCDKSDQRLPDAAVDGASGRQPRQVDMSILEDQKVLAERRVTEPTPAPTAAATSTAPATQSGNLTSEAASFGVPNGWKSLPPEGAGIKALMASPDSTPSSPKALINVVISPTQATDAETAVKAIADRFGGTINTEATTLGNSPAAKATSQNPTNVPPGVVSIVQICAIHNGKAYLIQGMAVSGKTVDEDVEQVRKSWAWTDVPADSGPPPLVSPVEPVK